MIILKTLRKSIVYCNGSFSQHKYDLKYIFAYLYLQSTIWGILFRNFRQQNCSFQKRLDVRCCFSLRFTKSVTVVIKPKAVLNSSSQVCFKHCTGILVTSGGRWEGIVRSHRTTGVLCITAGDIRLDARKLRCHANS